MKIIGWVLAACIAFGSYGRSCATEQEIPPQVLVVFGATGDLTKRGLVPALVRLAQNKKLPDQFACIGVGLGSEDQGQFRKELATFIPDSHRKDWAEIEKKFSFVSGCFEDTQTFQALDEQIRKYTGEKVFYLAVPPICFALIIEQLHKHGLLDEKKGRARVVVEKPFGLDLATAKELQQKLATCLQESQIFRMDHFLGKEIARQLILLRFSNPFIEKIWNKENIDHISITISENRGIGSRGLFWEQTGYLRDVVQNHMMQLVCLLGMERPSVFSAEAVQEEKCRVMRAVRPIPESQVHDFIRGGQYRQGRVEGQSVQSYREEGSVSPASFVETSIIGKLFIDNERWKDVPFYIKGGKRLSQNRVEITVFFRTQDGNPPNRLVFRIQPTEEIALFINAPDSSGNMQSHKVNLPFKADSSSMPAAYEKLLHEVMIGDRSHFASYEEIALSWKLFAPVLNRWQKDPTSRAIEYIAGSEGPVFEELKNERN